MEQKIGIAWHQLLNRLAAKQYPLAAVALSDQAIPKGQTTLAHSASLLFRALGGDHGIEIQAGAQSLHSARRSLLSRLAGSERKVDLAWVDHQALRLPPVIDAYPDRQLNHALYYWLAALCAVDSWPHLPWFNRNQHAVKRIITHYPGLAASYFRLVEAEISRRPDITTLAVDQARQEYAIQDALRHPGSVTVLPTARYAPHPVLLWLRPDPQSGTSALKKTDSPADTAMPPPGKSTLQTDTKRRIAEHTEMPERKSGLLLFRPESIFSWTEYAKIDHETKENEDDELAQAADDLDVIALARESKQTAKKLRMTLDIAAVHSKHSALTLGEQHIPLLPEWDYRSRTLKPDQCRINIMPIGAQMQATAIVDFPLPEHLKREQQRLRRQFGALLPLRQRLKGQADGNEIDINAYLREVANLTHRNHTRSSEPRFYLDQRKRERDLACLLLADLSLSTEAWVGDDRRVIDVIRDSLYLFSEALSVTKDRFALHGFCSKQRNDVRFYPLKEFDEPYNDIVRSRINAITPAYYTRMGAAIRHGSTLLGKQKATERLLLILTDGKPNDADHYEGRYGIEDTRKALIEARQQGLRPFCVTVDQEAHDYLPHIFGKNNFIIIRKPSELPARLPLLYAQLTQG